jgi:FkbM family methyltransferase
VDAVKYYIDALPTKENCIKLNLGISNVNTVLNVYYIPEESIEKNNLPEWFKGCNCINTFHPLHIKHNVTHLCKIDQVKVITSSELFYQNKVKTVDFLKIDTEGHDCIILNALYSYLKYLPKVFYPRKILFETNDNIEHTVVDETISLYTSIGYKIQSRGYDTILILSA